MTQEIIIAAIGLFGGGGLVAWIRFRKKDSAQAFKIAVEALNETVKALRAENNLFYEQNKMYRASDDEKSLRIFRLEQQVHKLEEQVNKLNEKLALK